MSVVFVYLLVEQDGITDEGYFYSFIAESMGYITESAFNDTSIGSLCSDLEVIISGVYNGEFLFISGRKVLYGPCTVQTDTVTERKLSSESFLTVIRLFSPIHPLIARIAITEIRDF
ncbi:MAG: hypothetical protein K8S15_12440, partial [Candidatus Aegiribacteria sp.]|nr:hypothetical protein [Candidatus Aegiribacteria sp.]